MGSLIAEHNVEMSTYLHHYLQISLLKRSLPKLQISMELAST